MTAASNTPILEITAEKIVGLPSVWQGSLSLSLSSHYAEHLSASSPRGGVTVMSTLDTGLVKFKYDPENPPTMTEGRLQALRDLRDEDIDYSDIPPIRDFTGWRRAAMPVRDLVPEENKQQVTLRLDADVLGFFKSTGRRYQSRINAALREYMLAHRAPR